MKRSGKSEHELVFKELPTMLDAYKKFVGKRPGLEQPGAPLPDIGARLESYPLSRPKIDAYREVCGIPRSKDYFIPLLYPQVLAGALHAQIFAHPKFPLQAAGLIHVGNTVTQHRPSRIYEPLSFEVKLRGTRPARKGHEFDLLTYAYVEDELVWEASTTILSPQRFSEEPEKTERRVLQAPEAPLLRSTTIEVLADQGRRYGGVSGDYNPIHLHALTAKLFGFKRAIAHGMWTLARTLAEVEDDMPADGRVFLEVGFKRPVYLPSTIVLNASKRDDSLFLEARAPRGDTLHLLANIHPLDQVEESIASGEARSEEE